MPRRRSCCGCLRVPRYSLATGDIIATGRPGDEGMLSVLQGLQGGDGTGTKLKLIGACKYPKACAVSTSQVRDGLSEFVGTIAPAAAADGVRALLQANDLFNDAPAEDLDRLGFEFKPAAYNLQRQGEMGEYFSLLVEGNVKVTQNAKVKGPRGEARASRDQLGARRLRR